jgi:hypothetical protein
MIASEGPTLNSIVIMAPTAGPGEAATAASINTEDVENVNINVLVKPTTSMYEDGLCNSAAKTSDGVAFVSLQTATAAAADCKVVLEVQARPVSAPLEALDMNIAKSQEEEDLASLMVADGSTDTEFASVDSEEVEDEESESDAESDVLLPDIPQNSDQVPAAPSTDSDVSVSSSDFTFDVDSESGEKKVNNPTTPTLPPKVVRPPPIFVNNIEDFNSSDAKKPRLDLGNFTTPEHPADADAAATAEERRPRPVPRVSEEALASLSPTHIASDLLKYFYRTRTPTILQRIIAPVLGLEEPTAAVVEEESIFGFGSPVDNIVREPAPWELAFGSPVEDAPRPPAPWEEETVENEKVDPLKAPLPDNESIVENHKEEEWAALAETKWHEDAPTSNLDLYTIQREWDIYCKERSQTVAAMLAQDDTVAAAEAKVEAAKIAFKELGSTARSTNKRKISRKAPRSKLTCRNLRQRNRSASQSDLKVSITKSYVDSLVSVTSPMKHRFLEEDYNQQVWRRMTPTKPGYGTGLGIALEYPTSENSQRDMHLAEDAAAQAMFYFSNGVEYIRPPVQRSRDEVENLPLNSNPELYKRSGVIMTRESDGLPFHCSVTRPPLDLAMSQRRKKSGHLKKKLISDVWKGSSSVPGENTVYNYTLDKVKMVKDWMRPRLRDTFFEYRDKVKDAAKRISEYPSDLVIYILLGI